MDDTEKAILGPAKLKVKLKAANVDICYTPIFQSGGQFDLRPNSSSNNDHIYYDATSVIICAIGSRCNSYCSNVARTYLIDADDIHKKADNVLLKAHEAAIGSLKPGKKIGDAYKAPMESCRGRRARICIKFDQISGNWYGSRVSRVGFEVECKE
ncbi:hypothetical protein AMTR_s00039p00161570 [Amborella trichopoda]|uniref:FACT complex subunit n=1 Tax=Amborella trichopoda TaxID=13333 RepID=U5CRI1_AMBTC|nr:hypothetical protein AMTR_s00039p00161570 [Amborella trichopoda]